MKKSNIGRAVLVTGASSGIGRATAVHLDKLGFTVLAGVRKQRDGELLVAEAGGIRPLIIDVTRMETVRAAVAEVRAVVNNDGLYGLVNNAGIAVVGPVEALALDDIRKQFEVNVIGQLAVTQAMLPLIRQAQGRVVIMGSIFGLLSCPYLGVYAGSKHALEALADSLRVELAPWNINVSLIEPGRMATSIWGKSFDAMEEWKVKSDGVYDLYRDAMASARRKGDEFARTSASPGKVARAVAHALTAHRPRTRYRVGHDAKFWGPLRRMAPDRLADWVINQMLRMGS